jgi:beta-galactosidase/beta-glucuronidase
MRRFGFRSLYRVFASLLFVSALLAQQATDIPRPEFPQPQWEREHWLNLNGQWQFAFDDADEGLAGRWFENAHQLDRTITVPFAFETKLSGIEDTTFHPVIWYKRTFQVPSGWPSGRTHLIFGAVDYRADVWVNGIHAGYHRGGSVPFRLDISKLLAGGENVVTLRVEDPPQDRGIPRGKQYWQEKSRGIFYTRTSGIWQTVWVERVGDSHLAKGRFHPELSGRVTLDLRIGNPRPGDLAVARISWQGTELARSQQRIAGEQVLIAAGIEKPRQWSLNNPNLYDLQLEIHRDGEVIDRVTSYFGFRRFSAENGMLYLNRNKIYLKMVLDQGYWRDSTLTAPTDEALKRDIELAIQMGFNGARKHQKLEDPRYLYWADKLGFLVSSEMANAFPERYDEISFQRFTTEWMEAVERDINHPSIVMWLPINESWGVPEIGDERQVQFLHSLYHLTKSLDTTRPVIVNDGWEQSSKTDIMSFHDYSSTGEQLTRWYRNLESKAGERLLKPGRRAMIPGESYQGAPLFLSEFGGIARIIEGMETGDDAWGYAGVMKSEKEAMDRMRGIWEALAEMPQIVGICYTQMTDVEQEINGLYTIDRRPKFPPEEVKKLNDMLR